MPRRFRPAWAVAFLVAGLASAAGQSAQDDSSNPHYKQAQQDLDNNDPTGAAEEYEAALAANPKLAGAHYELGVLYAEKLSQPVSAIYHLERFLKLAPTSDHAPAAREMIETEGEAFAASLPNSSLSSAQIARIELENAALKKQADDAAHTIAQLQAQLGQANAEVQAARAGAPSVAGAGTPPAGGTLPPPSAPVASPDVAVGSGGLVGTNAAPAAVAAAAAASAPPSTLGTPRTYTVRQGDILWNIAKKMYPHHNPNDGVKKIQDANKDTIKGTMVHVGQVLVIPD